MINMQTTARYIRCRSCESSKRFIATVNAKADCIVDNNGVVKQIAPTQIVEAEHVWLCVICGGEAYYVNDRDEKIVGN
jgi:DNA-directed RNA polymerase subunit RPC12/RpoP